MEETYYETLGVTSAATIEEIGRAHRALVRQVHPDGGGRGDPEKLERFKKIQKAFEVLSDGEKRQRYDATGSQDDTLEARIRVSAVTILNHHLKGIVISGIQQGRDLEETNLVLEIEKAVKEELKELKKAIKDIPKAVKKAEAVAARFRSSGEENLMLELMNRSISDLKLQAATAEKGIFVREEALEILKGYSYDAKIARPSETAFFTFTFGNASKLWTPTVEKEDE